MIIKELSKFIILDEIRTNADSAEVYFLSHLLGNEMLTIPENWPGKIYTSEFILDVLSKKQPAVPLQYFKILQANVPMKLKSKDKTIMATMFETGEITHNVMFFFDDGLATYLYTGVFTEIGSLYLNEKFMLHVQKGIDKVYIDTTRCKGRYYIFTEDTVNEIKQIATSHPDTKLAVVIPTFGYEKLLVHLAKEFPQDVYPTKNQRRVLAKLGYKDLMAKSSDSRIIILSPGITSDFIESCSNQIVTVYISGLKAPTDKASVCGMYLRQWSPLPSLMDLQALLDIIRPKSIIPIKKVPLEQSAALPACLEWFTDRRRTTEDDVRSNAAGGDSHESDADSESVRSIHLSDGTEEEGTSEVSVKKEKSNSPEAKNQSSEKVAEPTKPEESPQKEPVVSKSRGEHCDLTVKRCRIISKRTHFDFTESDEEELRNLKK